MHSSHILDDLVSKERLRLYGHQAYSNKQWRLEKKKELSNGV